MTKTYAAQINQQMNQLKASMCLSLYGNKMPRHRAAKQLLLHGALTRGQFTNYTGWKPATVTKALNYLVKTRAAVVTQDADGQNVWGLK